MVKSDLIKVNEKLKNDILSRIPKGYSKLEKAIFIYYELCKKLNYSLEFYVNKNFVDDYFLDINNLKKVDGEQNNEVVCYTFNAIFTKLLSEANLCDVEPTNQIKIENGEFYPYHEALCIKIDGEEFSIDPTYGVLDNNDLTMSKYSDYLLEGWEPETGLPPAEDQRLFRKIKRAIKKVQGDNQKLSTSVKEYLRAKALDDSYEEFSLDDRVRMFLEGLSFCPEYSVLSFNYLLKLKRRFFTKAELGDNGQLKTNIDLVFTKNSDCEYEAYLFYNSKGYIPDVDCENFDALKIWKISIKNKTIENLTIDELNSLLNDRSIISRGQADDVFNFGLTQIGFPHLTPVVDPKTKQVVGCVRTHLLDGRTETLTVEEGEKLIKDFNEVAAKKLKNKRS